MRNDYFALDTVAIYVEDGYNPHFNEHIASTINLISTQLSEHNIQFIYLPIAINDLDYRKIVDYNRPHLNAAFKENSLHEIYVKLKTSLKKPFPGEGLIWKISNYHASEGFEFNQQEDLHTQLKSFISQVEKKKALGDGLSFFTVEEKKYPYCKEYNYTDTPQTDLAYSTEDYKLADDIRQKIYQLKESGSIKLLDDILEEVLDKKPTLSELFITKDYRIFMKDYAMREVVMAPLPKALFFLFLRHPEGILFKELRDYRDELLSIYKNVTTHEDLTRIIKSINAMTDPINNSVNEKCSRIRAAFLEVVADDIATNYYITGCKGEPKKIMLDRSLVQFQ